MALYKLDTIPVGYDGTPTVTFGSEEAWQSPLPVTSFEPEDTTTEPYDALMKTMKAMDASIIILDHEAQLDSSSGRVAVPKMTIPGAGHDSKVYR